MSETPEQVAIDGRLLQFEDIKHNLAQIQAGDTVRGIGEIDTFDQLVIGMVNTTISSPRPGSHNYWNISSTRAQMRPEYLAARGPTSLGADNRYKYKGWPSGVRLPSEVVKPPKYYGRLPNLGATLLRIYESQEEGQPTRRGLDVLLSADIHPTGKGIQGHAAVLLSASGTLTGPRRISYIRQSKDTANSVAEALEALQAESIDTARAVTISGLRSAFSAGAPGTGKR